MSAAAYWENKKIVKDLQFMFSDDAKYFCFYLYPLLYIISVCISHCL